MQKQVLFIFLILFSFVGVSQTQYNLKGRVLDSKTNEKLVGATVFIAENNKALLTDANGEFLISLAKGVYTVSVNYVGYKELLRIFLVSNDTLISFYLESQAVTIKPIVVTKHKKDENIQSVTIGQTTLTQQNLRSVPTLMGEPDVIRVLAANGGVRQIEGMQGMSVRGGSQEQNLILFDNAIVYNPSHLLGFFSVFQAEIVGEANLYKSGLPAQYGGRLSSVLQIDSRKSNLDSVEANVSLGILSSRFMLSVPLDNKSGIRVSLRKSYLNLFVMPIVKDVVRNGKDLETSFGFTDGSFRYDYKKDSRNGFSISYYQGVDDFDLINKQSGLHNKVSWGNTAYNAWWMHSSRSGSIQKIGISNSSYNFNFNAIQNYYDLTISTGIENTRLFFENTKYSSKHVKMYGIHIDYTKYNSGTIHAIIDGDPITSFEPLLTQSSNVSIFYEDTYKPNERLAISYAGRLVPYAQLGPYTKYEFDDENIIVDSTTYKWNDLLYKNIGYELRLQLRYALTSQSSVKMAIERSNQSLHMVSMLSAALPADVWLPASNETPTAYGWQYSAGYYRNFEENMYEASLSIFYKQMNNLIEFKDGFVTLYSQTFNEKLAHGKGYAAGTEFIFKKNEGAFRGGITYSFSRTLRKFSEINNSIIYPASYDKPHDFTIQTQYVFSEKLSVSALWVWSSGKVYSEPTSRYFINKNLINEYGPINNSRMPAYHRLDLSAEYMVVKKSNFDLFAQISVYNAYNRNNSYYIYYETLGSVDNYSIQMNKTFIGLFPVLPSVSIRMDLK